MTWTPEQWQAHVTEQEKRINELERKVYKLEQAQVTPIRQERDLGRVVDDNSTETAVRLGSAWIA